MNDKFFVFDKEGNKINLIIESIEVLFRTPILTTNLGTLKVLFRMKKDGEYYSECVTLEKEDGEYFNITKHHRLINFICDNGGMKNNTLASYYTRTE